MEHERFRIWKKRLADVLKEHTEIGDKAVGQVEINLNVGGVSKVYKIKKRTKGNTIILEKTELK